MQFYIHPNADQDLERLSESDEDGVAYIDTVLEMMFENETLFYKLFSERYYRDYDPPTGTLGIEIKRIACLWGNGIKALRIRFDNESVLKYRVIYCTAAKKQPNGTYIQEVHILAVVSKEEDGFDYQPEHPIMGRIKNDYFHICAG